MTKGPYTNQPHQYFSQGLFEISSTKKHRLGTIRTLDDGRTFVYAKAGAAELAPGKLTCAEAPSTYWLNKALGAASAIGSQTFYLTVGAAAITANELADGFLYVNDATGEGRGYKIRGNTAFESSGAGYVYTYDAVRDIDLTTSSEITLFKSPFEAVIINPTSLTSILTGVPVVTVTAEYYYWSQVKGLCPVLLHGTVVVGNMVGPSSQSTPVAGAVEALATSDIIGACGWACNVNADTEYGLIQLAVRGF